MNFIKNVFSFHADVIKKINLNKLFFLFAALMYLASDFITYLMPTMSNYFANPQDENGISGALLKWVLFFAVWLAYFVTASLLTVYFIRKDKSRSKFKAYLSPLINMRVYGAYFFFVFGIMFSLFIATKFLPAITDFMSEGFKIAADNKVTSDLKMTTWLSSPLLQQALDNTAFWQWILAIISFITVLLTVAMSFVFALPLVVKSKSNTLYASLKKSFNGVKNNFAMFLFTILTMVVLKYLIPTLLDTVIPESLIATLVEHGVHYATRPLVSLYDALLFFYVIVGLEKFILTNDKK